MNNYLKLAALLFFCHSAVAQDGFDLTEMSESDKNKTGLYKLSGSEIKSLEKWLNNKKEQQQTQLKQQNVGFEQQVQADRDTIVTTLEKMYKDPLGNTFFKLTNGQVWKQTQSGRASVSNDGTQTITIEPKMLGSWVLKGDGNRSVKVKRVR